MIPQNIEEALIAVKEFFYPEELQEIDESPDIDNMIKYHHTVGRAMRNYWGLWKKGTKLKEVFKKLGIHHPDDISSIILNSFWKERHGQPIELEAQVKKYIDYWAKLNEQADNSMPIEEEE